MTQDNERTSKVNRTTYDDDTILYYPKGNKKNSKLSINKTNSINGKNMDLNGFIQKNTNGGLNGHTRSNGISKNHHSEESHSHHHNENNTFHNHNRQTSNVANHSHSHSHNHNHNNHDHSHHNHDNSHHNHDHSHHNHDHTHHNHDHSHHDHHNHEHNHHNHEHEHGHCHNHTENIMETFDGQLLNLPSFTSAYRDQLSFYQLIKQVSQHQSTHCRRLLQYAIFQSLLGSIILSLAIYVESLALTAIGYVTLFDALGLVNSLLAKLSIEPSISDSSDVYLYGLKRFEIVFNFVTVLYALFAAINMIKESIETMLLGEFDHAINPSTLFLGYGSYLCIPIIINIVIYLITIFPYRTHGFFSQLRFQNQRTTAVKQLKPVNSFIVSSLIFSILTICLLTNFTFGFHPEFFDALLSLLQAIVLLYLLAPLSITISLILMQSLPNYLHAPLKRALGEVTALPYIDRYDNLHVWQNGYGDFIGTVQFFAHHDVDLDHVDPITLYSPFNGIIDNINIELLK